MNVDFPRFNSYVNNIVTKIFNAFTDRNLENIDHFIGDKLYKKIDELIQKNDSTLFDFNIIDSYMINIKEKKHNIVIDYYISINYKKRNEEDFKTIYDEYKLKFIKSKDTKIQNSSRKCPNCGSNMDINNSGKCEYCGSIYDLENYDFILVDYKKI